MRLYNPVTETRLYCPENKEAVQPRGNECPGCGSTVHGRLEHWHVFLGQPGCLPDYQVMCYSVKEVTDTLHDHLREASDEEHERFETILDEARETYRNGDTVIAGASYHEACESYVRSRGLTGLMLNLENTGNNGPDDPRMWNTIMAWFIENHFPVNLGSTGLSVDVCHEAHCFTDEDGQDE